MQYLLSAKMKQPLNIVVCMLFDVIVYIIKLLVCGDYKHLESGTLGINESVIDERYICRSHTC